MKYKYVLLLLGSTILNAFPTKKTAFPMEKTDDESKDEEIPKAILAKDLLQYGVDIANSPQYNPDIQEPLREAFFDDKSPLNKVVIPAQKKESADSKTDKKS